MNHLIATCSHSIVRWAGGWPALSSQEALIGVLLDRCARDCSRLYSYVRNENCLNNRTEPPILNKRIWRAHSGRLGAAAGRCCSMRCSTTLVMCTVQCGCAYSVVNPDAST